MVKGEEEKRREAQGADEVWGRVKMRKEGGRRWEEVGRRGGGGPRSSLVQQQQPTSAAAAAQRNTATQGWVGG